jgi:DNA-binding HxlR family transcriptional regulator
VGPKRFKDLEVGLPGIGTNILTDRLRQLEEEGILRRASLCGPVVPVYQLTDVGRDLEPVILALARWGEMYLPTAEAEFVRAEWAVVSLKGIFRAEEAAGVRETYEFRMGDETLHVCVNDGEMAAAMGPATQPDVIIAGPLEVFLESAAGATDLKDAVEQGRVSVQGDPEALARIGRMFPPRSERLSTEASSSGFESIGGGD